MFARLVAKLTCVEIDPGLAAGLAERFAGSNIDVEVGGATRLRFPEGRFSGAVCFSMLHHVPTVELQDRLFAEVARVLQSGAAFVAVDGLESDAVREFHAGDNYLPIDPETLPGRLSAAGFTRVEILTNQYGWGSRAQRVGQTEGVPARPAGHTGW